MHRYRYQVFYCTKSSIPVTHSATLGRAVDSGCVYYLRDMVSEDDRVQEDVSEEVKGAWDPSRKNRPDNNSIL